MTKRGDWFYYTSGGNAFLARLSEIVEVADKGTSILLTFRNGETVHTGTYDLTGFVSNVLENDALIEDLAEGD